MLSLDDTDLVRRDASIPGLPVLLDPDALLKLLQPYLPGVEGPIETQYLRYKPARSCVVGYRAHCRGEMMLLYARAGRRQDSAKIRDDEKSPRAPLHAPIVLSELNTVVRLFPQDPKLRVLPRLSGPDERRELLRGLLPERPEFWDATVRCLRYKPERRYVGELLVDHQPVAILRAYTKIDYRAAARGAEEPESQGALRFPQRLGGGDRHCTLIYEWLDGCPLRDSLAKVENPEAVLRRVGASVAEFHAQTKDAGRIITPDEQATSVIRLAETVSALCPTMARRVNGLGGEIAQRVLDAWRAESTIHGDFHAGQVLLTEDSVGFIDLDQIACGDPAFDLGTFIAQLYRGSISSGEDTAQVRRWADAICGGYFAAMSNAVSRGREALYTAAGLLQIAPHFFRRRDPDWGEKINRAISLAEEELPFR